MEYDDLLSSLEPKLRQIALKYRGCVPCLDEEDLFSEMALHLWESWNRNEFADKTESYIVQACYFHVRNLMRTAGEGRKTMALDDPAGDDNGRLEDIIPDGDEDIAESSDGRVFYDTVMNNGLTTIEKNVFLLLYRGCTAREIGRSLHISHTMVLKHKQNIAYKVSKDHGYLLV